MKCNRDCFNCPHPDCCNDVLDQADYEDLLRIDRMLFPEFYTASAVREREMDRRRYDKTKNHSNYDPAKRRAQYERNRQRCLAYQHDYHLMNREAENQKRRERRRATAAEGGKA